MHLKKLICRAAALGAVFALASCITPKKITYFQNLPDGAREQIARVQSITVQPYDKLSIIVKSKNQELSALFNLGVVTYRAGEVNDALSGYNQIALYTVDTAGEIDFPILGKIKVAGLRRDQIAERIKQKLVDSRQVLDAVVTVEFGNLNFSVLGEVAHPGRFSIDRDRITLLDALSQAGDLTIYGRRDNVLVMRGEGDSQRAYRVNLNAPDSLFLSPVYYVQQNDVIYVDPNITRQRQSTVNGNNVVSASFWVSIASLLTSIAVLIFK